MPKLELPKVDLKKVELPKLDLKKVEIPAVAAKPVYAGVGATDLAVEKVRGYVTDAQAKVLATVADVQKSVKGFEAKSSIADSRTKAEAKFAEFQADALAYPTKVQAQVKEAYDENLAKAEAAYADLAKRGEAVVVKLRAGETPAPAAKKAPAKKAAAKKAPAKKAAAKKAPAKKAAAAEPTA